MSAIERIIQRLDDIVELLDIPSSGGSSSIEIEDLASKPEPKVTTKVFVSSPLTQSDINLALEAHAYAKRKANEMAMNGWQSTVDMLKARLEELPEFK